MWKCENCGHRFDEFKEIPAEIYFGVDDLFTYRCGNKVSVCPKCESNDVHEDDMEYEESEEE